MSGALCSLLHSVKGMNLCAFLMLATRRKSSLRPDAPAAPLAARAPTTFLTASWSCCASFKIVSPLRISTGQGNYRQYVRSNTQKQQYFQANKLDTLTFVHLQLSKKKGVSKWKTKRRVSMSLLARLFRTYRASTASR